MTDEIELKPVETDLGVHAFEYQYGGEQWEFTIRAGSAQEALDRLRFVSRAEYCGEIIQTIRVFPNQIAFGLVIGLGIGLLVASWLS